MAQKGSHESPREDIESTMPLQSPDSRRPQLNSTVCGCHCGRASNSFGSDGEGGAGSDGMFPSNLQNNRSDVPLADRSFLEGDEGAAYVPGTVPPSPIQLATIRVDTLFADIEYGRDGFQYGQAKIIQGEPFRRVDALAEMFERPESPDSLANHIHNSDRPSIPPSVVMTQRSSSPGPVWNELGTWTGSTYFVHSPLSLAPQWQIPLQPRFQHISENGAPEEYPESILPEDLNGRHG
jgi:hypothetical protein